MADAIQLRTPPGTAAMRLVGDIVADIGDAVAATLGSDGITFAQLERDANGMAHALQAGGVERGAIVAWWSGPDLRILTGMLACAKLGAVFAPLAPALALEELRTMLDYLGPRMLVCDGGRFQIGSTLGGVELESLASTGDLVAPDMLDEQAPHIVYLTSGSTGRPKGVLVSHRASLLRSRAGGGSFTDHPRGVLCSFPLYHYGGWHYVLEAWLNHTAAHLVSRADGPSVLEAVERRRPEAIYCIPAVWERVLAHDGDLSSIRYADTGTSAVADDLIARMSESMPGARTTILYGATEAGRMTALRHDDRAQRRGSVGRAVEPGRIALAEDGEIVFTGPTLMNGYLDMPDATEEAITDGWYHTGDLGALDDDGFLYITGRKREIIRSAGETIAPVEVEAALGTVPGVRELAVIGIPDPRWGELVCAAIVPADGAAPPTVEQLRARLPDLAPHKRPRLVAAVAEIPRTGATGQVIRAALRDAVMAQLHPATDP